MRIQASLLIALQCLFTAASAQEPPVSPSVPASVLLRYRPELELTEAQVKRLEELARTQTSSLSKATTAYLRAEADVIDATRGDDLVVRRAALEKRAKLAIDAEILRLRSEKEARAVLGAKQVAALASLEATGEHGIRERPHAAIWRAIVAPSPIVLSADPVSDSGEVRISVLPNYADIWVGGEKRGTGRKFLMLPVGKHEMRVAAVGCTESVIAIEVRKGSPTIVTETLTCGR